MLLVCKTVYIDYMMMYILKFVYIFFSDQVALWSLLHPLWWFLNLHGGGLWGKPSPLLPLICANHAVIPVSASGGSTPVQAAFCHHFWMLTVQHSHVTLIACANRHDVTHLLRKWQQPKQTPMGTRRLAKSKTSPTHAQCKCTLYEDWANP